MIHVEASSVLAAPVDRVWEIVRDFAAPTGWLPGVDSVSVDAGAHPARVGATRRLEMSDGAVLRERLLGLSEVEHRLEFEIYESPLPISGYIATIELRPVTDGDRTFIRWFATFDSPPEHAQQMSDRMPRDIYLPAFRALAALVEKE